VPDLHVLGVFVWNGFALSYELFVRVVNDFVEVEKVFFFEDLVTLMNVMHQIYNEPSHRVERDFRGVAFDPVREHFVMDDAVARVN
jgi:hypothetical protein